MYISGDNNYYKLKNKGFVMKRRLSDLIPIVLSEDIDGLGFYNNLNDHSRYDRKDIRVLPEKPVFIYGGGWPRLDVFKEDIPEDANAIFITKAEERVGFLGQYCQVNLNKVRDEDVSTLVSKSIV